MIRSLINTTQIFRLSHYLDNHYDSNVIFVATVNNLNFQQPLLDSIEIIQLFVYTEEEKLQIGLQGSSYSWFCVRSVVYAIMSGIFLQVRLDKIQFFMFLFAYVL
ncbi:Lon protease [Anaplasma phagocytophilum]|uniref:Lon protease n=1 Tax=Anaplasma phagocytophilum TaxID=948 RepID=A0AA45ZHR8_ANAPH|nr:hypothetical protein [Anaplasma phagocytophilum]SBO14443.1 Lon protease [Anaplasma phagocytophilum]